MLVFMKPKQLQLSFEKDGSFAVKEFKGLNIVGAFVFYAMFLYGLCNTKLSIQEQEPIYDKMLLLALVPALVFTKKVFSKHIYIRINTNGIYINNFFLTDWKNFRSAEYTQAKVVGSFQDNFVLVVNYFKPEDGYYMKEIALTNTQDKAEEEIIAAIDHFYNCYQASLNIDKET